MDCNRDSKDIKLNFNINDSNKMMSFLKKEEQFYIKMLQNMRHELKRLEIEELILKARIRQEQVQIEKEVSNTEEEQKIKLEESEIGNSQESKSFQSLELSNIRSVSPETDAVESNITDDRYLEPLILNPNTFDDNAFLEFDD